MLICPRPKVFTLIREINLSPKFKGTMFRRYVIPITQKHEALTPPPKKKQKSTSAGILLIVFSKAVFRFYACYGIKHPAR